MRLTLAGLAPLFRSGGNPGPQELGGNIEVTDVFGNFPSAVSHHLATVGREGPAAKTRRVAGEVS
jgi:hypothetical protein